MRKILIIICLFLGLIFTNVNSFEIPQFRESARIWMDGKFSDWDAITPIYTDTSGDQQTGNIDFGELKIANDERFLFFYIEIGEELNMQDNNAITLYLDTDNDQNTGISLNGIGADISWTFGEREGEIVLNSSPYNIYHEDLGLISSPTVSSNKFEIALDRTLDIWGNPLFPENSFKMVFHDNGPGQDYLPNSGETVSYSFDSSPLPPIPTISLQKPDDSDFRTVAYNVLSNNIFEPDLYEYFDRILSAIEPNLIAFSEIYDQTANDVSELVESMLPSSAGEQWYCQGIMGDDIYAVSRFPILESHEINKSGAFLIDLNPQVDSQLLFITCHLSYGSYNLERQLEIDELMAFIREAKQPGGVLSLEENTPIIILGDLNLVGYAQQLETLLTGEIVNQQFGPSFSPDWDGSDFGDLCARLTNLPMYFTWYSPYSSFSPGRLDFIIYSDYVLSSENKFVLFTPEMDADTLAAYELQPDDVTQASDHVPLVSDFKVLEPYSVGGNLEAIDKKPINIFPNPFWDSTTIALNTNINNYSKAEITICNIKGQIIKIISVPQNSSSVVWDGRDKNRQKMGSGIYLCKLKIDNKMYGTEKIILMK